MNDHLIRRTVRSGFYKWERHLPAFFCFFCFFRGGGGKAIVLTPHFGWFSVSSAVFEVKS